MRTKGYKCYNIKCGACVGKTLCGLYGDEALTCVDRMVNQKTNADRIRAMSDEELAAMLAAFCDVAECRSPSGDVCPFRPDCPFDCLALGGWKPWLQQPVKEDA